MTDLLQPDDEKVELDPKEAAARSFYDKTYAPKPATPDLPKATEELRSDPARRMFSAASMYGNDIKLEGPPVDASPELREAVDAYNAEVLEIYQDLELDSGEARQVTELFQQHATNPADAATRMQWRGEADQALRERYGNEAGQALELAKRLVQRDRRVADLLQLTGLGDHKDMVMKLAEKARSMYVRGKLKPRS